MEIMNLMQIFCISNGSHGLLDSENTTQFIRLQNITIVINRCIARQSKTPTWFNWFIEFVEIYLHYWCILDDLLLNIALLAILFLYFINPAIQFYYAFEILPLCIYRDRHTAQPYLKLIRTQLQSESWFTRPIVSDMLWLF